MNNLLKKTTFTVKKNISSVTLILNHIMFLKRDR